MSLTVFADTIGKNISVVYRNIKIFVDGNQIEAVDEKGNKTEAFLLKGNKSDYPTDDKTAVSFENCTMSNNVWK